MHRRRSFRIPIPAQAVLYEAALTDKIGRHEGQRGGVRVAGGTCAWVAGMRLGEWVREALLSAPAESGPDSGEVALAEVLALRSLLLNLHFRSATIPEAEMRGLIERADGSKLERARERLTAARAATKATEPEQESEPEEV